MRMANHEKDVETHPECTTEETTQRSETTPTSCPSGEEPAVTSESSAAGLLSMPCLLKELRPQAAPNSKLARPADDSDSSPCLLSPSSSGHLGDSDTQTSADEGTRVPGSAPGDPVPTGRKSRRSRSESDTPTAAMAAKKNRCQERQVNGRVRVRGQRSRLQKERMRMRRQKREAAARRKPDLLQDSSTSDSDITAHSSSSSSSSENENATGISSHIPGQVEGEHPQVSPSLSDSEVEIVGVQENARFPRGGVIQAISSWKAGATPAWNASSAQSGWTPSPEVVDLTLEDDRHRYLL
ncbi:protein ARK2N isoform X3 [Denticeps clupeoides]|uniref:protein ARK2N isoform X3 n=1 Tax=Denticeps clupeoides TaxID=299321 RepID=UPI0010A421BC|nr:uncharacterized protein C18orf25 homolog isoform X3 [Denticeps clupeoides]